MGIKSALILRFRNIGRAGPFIPLPDHIYHYAMSATISPKETTLHSHVAHPPPDIKKQGVLSEQASIFTSLPLPASVAAFLDSKPTVAVTISSFGEVKNVSERFPTSTKFQVLFIDSSCSSDKDPNHMHYNGTLDLGAVFLKAALIVHGCGAGTCHQVALLGKPSIGLSGFREQECNGVALERMGISKHFLLKSLYSDHVVAVQFIEAIISFFDGNATFAHPLKLVEVQRAMCQEETLAYRAFFEKMRELTCGGPVIC